MAEACANCGADLTGAYCAVCGQKRFVEADRRFGQLARQFVAVATDLDGRFWGSLRALLLQPGELSLDYIEGRRARRMSPVALFLLVTVFYFFFVRQSDFATPFEWEVPGRIVMLARDGSVDPADAARLRAKPGPLHSRVTAALVDRRVQARDAAARAASDGRSGYDYRDYRRAYDAKVPQISKALAVVHVPFLAAALMLLFLRRRHYYAEHFVVALHLLAFAMVSIQILVLGMDLVHSFVPRADWHQSLLDWIVRAVLTIYVVIALHRVYAVGWRWATAATAGLFLAYVLINFYLYRPVLFLTVFALT
jgi:Protein of unknown function (DUF3667)